jgi:hypothetical protein
MARITQLKHFLQKQDEVKRRGEDEKKSGKKLGLVP